MKYEISAIGNCVQDIFILANSRIVNSSKKSDSGKLLAYQYGDKVNVDVLKYSLGGEACNAAVSIRRLGLKSAIVSMVGDDLASREVLSQAKRERVGTSFLISENNKEIGRSFILLGPDRDRTILAYRTNNDFKKVLLGKMFRSSCSYYIGGINKYSAILQKPILNDAIRHKKDIYINPSAYQIDYDKSTLKKILRYTKIFAANVEESRAIVGKKKIKIKDLLSSIYGLGPKVVLITDGKRGAYAYDGNHFYKSGIYSEKVLDATGAGDAFFSTFVVAYRKGYNIEGSLKLSAINASSVISKYGAQAGLMDFETLLKIGSRNKVKTSKF